MCITTVAVNKYVQIHWRGLFVLVDMATFSQATKRHVKQVHSLKSLTSRQLILSYRQFLIFLEYGIFA